VRRRTSGATAGAAAAALLALALAGCGVPTSGVIDVGPAASGMPGRVPATATVYLLLDGRLRPFARTAQDGPETVGTAVRLLFDGPTPAERAKGLTTRLPRVKSARVATEGRTITVDLEGAATPPDAVGLRQLACTVAAALPRADAAASPTRSASAAGGAGSAMSDTHATITVAGQGWRREPAPDDCPPPAALSQVPPTVPATRAASTG
jgi:hypothetical protein